MLARGKDTLESAKEEVSAHRKSSTQVVDTIAADLTDPVAVSIPGVNQVFRLKASYLHIVTYI